MAYTKQIWENLPSTNTPLSADRLNHMEQGIYDANNGLVEAQNSNSNSTTNPYSANYVNNNFQSNGTILWANSSPESTFAPQTITLNSDDYDCYEIIFRFIKDVNRTNSTGKVLKGSGTICTYAVGGNYYRTIEYASDTSLNVGAGQVITTFGGTPNTDNNWCIPLYVIGYKTGLFS